jgi:fatty acid desaturase
VQNEAEIRRIVGRERVRALSERSNGAGLAFLAGHGAALLATGSLVRLGLGSPWVWPALLLHGVVIVHLFAPFHETTHGTAFRTRWLNAAVSWVSGLALLLPPLHFKFEHAAHHSATQMAGRDPEMIAMAETLPGYLYYATAIPYFLGAFSSLLRHPFGLFTEEEREFLPATSLRRVQREAQAMWLVYALLAAASLALHSWVVVVYWLLPRFLGEPVMRLIRMSEHVGRPAVPDLLQNTRSVLTLAPLRWLNWNMGLHAAHHAIPLVPFFALPRLHRILEPHLVDVRRSYVGTQWLLIRNGWAHRHAPS